jgi:hypothetical protein
MVLLAGPGVLLSTFLLGSAVKVRASRNDDTFFFLKEEMIFYPNAS